MHDIHHAHHHAVQFGSPPESQRWPPQRGTIDVLPHRTGIASTDCGGGGIPGVVRGGARTASATMAATPGDTVASSGIWAISPGGAGGRPNAQAGKGRGGRVPGSFEVNQSGPKLGSGLIDPTLTSCTPGQARKSQEFPTSRLETRIESVIDADVM